MSKTFRRLKASVASFSAAAVKLISSTTVVTWARQVRQASVPPSFTVWKAPAVVG